ncbi:unnamed protein product [Macrosiphum euphorbiae]|uniref:MD-2-related lipid-recognition domain-containing protein n=1 Tax=Macrosiphum euphorbiae TaxID=13131 RepID=A0AAV0VLZ6_9HEMI|nr:unnamed protein product [Macrosiphum euphorbiae]
MKHNTFCSMLIQLIFTVGLGSSANSKPLLSSPIGPYKFLVKQVFNCNPTQDNKIQHNYYISHRANSKMLLGNTTIDVLFDDTFFLEMNMALKDSFGKWKENVFMHTTPNACSSIKKLIGNAANAFMHGFGLKNLNCPIPPGVYIGNGINESELKETNVPKTFFYGTYKFHVQYSRNNEKFGCQVYIIEFKRP